MVGCEVLNFVLGAFFAFGVGRCGWVFGFCCALGFGVGRVTGSLILFVLGLLLSSIQFLCACRPSSVLTHVCAWA